MYVIFEGIDGCGKTTIARLFVEGLELRNITSVHLREPTWGQYGQAARALIEAGAGGPRHELHRLLTLDRQEHVATKVKPALKFIARNPGFALVQDRGYLSAPAYQAEDDGRIDPMLQEQRSIAPQPNRFFVIDVPVEVAIRRITERGASGAKFERPDFLSTVRTRYLRMANDGDEPITVLDGALEPRIIVKNAMESLGRVT